MIMNLRVNLPLKLFCPSYPFLSYPIPDLFRSLAPSVCGWLLAHLRKRLLLIMEAGGGEAGPSVQGRRRVTGLTGAL